MIFKRKNKKKIKNFYQIFLVFIIGLASINFVFVNYAFAQDGKLTISITPPLIKNNINPGDVWKSVVKVVNNNSKAIDIYAQVVDFSWGKESGMPDLVVNEDKAQKPNSYSLSSWVHIETGPYKILPFASRNIPFIVDVPEDAEPGGHYAAILVGTKPPEAKINGSKVSSLLASLLLMRVQGNIDESGRIREFSTKKKIYSQPEVEFKVRFENIGNVHIQPQGEIRIYDMFNKNRGIIAINQATEFGNVLPKSIRSWKYNWQVENTPWNMGRYKARLILGYGENGRQAAEREIYFWVLNYKLLLIIGGSLFLLILFLVLFIRFYVRKSIKRAQQTVSSLHKEQDTTSIRKTDKSSQMQKVLNLKADINLKNKEAKKGGFGLFKKTVILLLVLLFVVLSVIYLVYLRSYRGNGDRVDDKQNYFSQPVKENIIKNNKNKINNIEKDKITSATSTVNNFNSIATSSFKEAMLNEKNKKLDFTVTVYNGSGIAGAASQVAKILQENNISVATTANADSYNYQNTEIFYQSDFDNEAAKIIKLLSLSITPQQKNDLSENIKIIIGKDFNY